MSGAFEQSFVFLILSFVFSLNKRYSDMLTQPSYRRDPNIYRTAVKFLIGVSHPPLVAAFFFFLCCSPPPPSLDRSLHRHPLSLAPFSNVDLLFFFVVVFERRRRQQQLVVCLLCLEAELRFDCCFVRRE